MSFWPAEFDPRSPAALVRHLASITTPDGDPARLIIGENARFTDVNGNEWIGSQLIEVGDIETAINGVAPSGTITLSFFQEPDAPDLVSQVRALGVDYIRNETISFYAQPMRDHSEFYAPYFEPILYMTRVMKRITTTLSGPLDRSITGHFESCFEGRKTARRYAYTVEDHERLLGHSNPSLEFIPTIDWQEESLF